MPDEEAYQIHGLSEALHAKKKHMFPVQDRSSSGAVEVAGVKGSGAVAVASGSKRPRAPAGAPSENTYAGLREEIFQGEKGKPGNGF